MSSVLFPVGPLPPRVYWVRRLVVLGLPLVLILAIAVSCSGGGKSPTASGTSNGPTTSPSTSSSSNPNAACAPGQLSAKLAVSSATSRYQIGESPTFTATITNVSGSSCQLTTNPANETWKVKSGAAEWWTTDASGGCTITNAPVTTSLAPAATRKVSISWNGYRLLPGCTRGEQAQAGTYVLRATLDGVTAQKAIFHFDKATP